MARKINLHWMALTMKRKRSASPNIIVKAEKITTNRNNNKELDDNLKKKIKLTEDSEITCKFATQRTQEERKERIEELTKEILKEVEDWKNNLIKEEGKLAEAQKAWSSLSNKLDKTHLPNRIK